MKLQRQVRPGTMASVFHQKSQVTSHKFGSKNQSLSLQIGVRLPTTASPRAGKNESFVHQVLPFLSFRDRSFSILYSVYYKHLICIQLMKNIQTVYMKKLKNQKYRIHRWSNQMLNTLYCKDIQSRHQTVIHIYK